MQQVKICYVNGIMNSIQTFNYTKLTTMFALLLLTTFTNAEAQQSTVREFQSNGAQDEAGFTVSIKIGDIEHIVTGGNKKENRMAYGIPAKKNSCELTGLGSEYKKYGYLDTNGNWAIQPTYDNAKDFHDGLGIVSQCVGSKINSWHILPDGKKLYQQKYENVGPFIHGYAIVDVDGAYHMCHIDKKGKPLYPQRYAVLHDFNKEGKTFAQRNISFKNDTCVWVVLNTKGQELYTEKGKYFEQETPQLVLDRLQ
jgi:hypothetical protein